MGPGGAAQVPRRVICVHGYGQCAATFRAKTGAARKALGKGAFEFVFLDAPHRAPPHHDAEEGPDAAEERSSLAWWVAGENDGTRTSLSRRAVGWEHSCSILAEELNKGYDGVIGFSQGAEMAPVLLARMHPVVQWAILIGGFVPADESLALELGTHQQASIPVRSLHVLGLGDERVPPERSRVLAAVFREPVLYEHDGGHHVPGHAAFRHALKEFVAAGQ